MYNNYEDKSIKDPQVKLSDVIPQWTIYTTVLTFGISVAYFIYCIVYEVNDSINQILLDSASLLPIFLLFSMFIDIFFRLFFIIFIYLFKIIYSRLLSLWGYVKLICSID